MANQPAEDERNAAEIIVSLSTEPVETPAKKQRTAPADE